MRILNNHEITEVSGAKPISFFASYVLGQNGYDPLTAIAVGTAISFLCLTPCLEAFTLSSMVTLGVTSLLQSGGGYALSSLVICGPNPKGSGKN